MAVTAVALFGCGSTEPYPVPDDAVVPDDAFVPDHRLVPDDGRRAPGPQDPCAGTARTPPPYPGDVASTVADAVTGSVNGADVGIVVLDRCANETVAAFGPDQPFYTASVVKLLIAVEILSRADTTGLAAADRREVEAMLARSDDGVASRLWDTHGGRDIVRADRTSRFCSPVSRRARHSTTAGKP
ncbi:serine hydrolase [Haloechinothrix alba]|uniref:serine hydrolase n=1 Tax=Haloechinothrix alba TaxID=664784 RepID=UPI001595B31A|nr:serine hydrolase [Haloechinothrix alba]